MRTPGGKNRRKAGTWLERGIITPLCLYPLSPSSFPWHGPAQSAPLINLDAHMCDIVTHNAANYAGVPNLKIISEPRA